MNRFYMFDTYFKETKALRITKSSTTTILIVLLMGILCSCSINQTSPYLDDNLSNRIELANSYFSNNPIYFDTSMFEKVATKQSAENQSKELIEVSAGTSEKLVEVLKLAQDRHKNIAISGLDSFHCSNILIKSVLLAEIPVDSGMHILFIGDSQYYKAIEERIGSRVNLFFHDFPETPPWTEDE